MKYITSFLYPIITLIIIIVVWHFAVILFQMPSYILPLPGAVANTIVDVFASGAIWPNISYTLQSTLIGYVIGCAGAVALGSIVAESTVFEKSLYPFVIAIQAMPKVALAPLLLVWFGIGLESKVVLVILICFFPLFINTVVAIKQADQDLIEMCRAFSASRTYIFFNVKIPCAANSIFAGLQIGVALALIGAVVGEFVASSKGLGYMIDTATVNMNVSVMLTGIIVLAVLGVAGTQIIRTIHRKVVFWNPDKDTTPQ
jgi:NitT/TauT family transport system permease protein